MAVITKANRIDLRVTELEKELLEKAASSNHLSLTSYILSICLKQAEYDIQQNEIITLRNKERDLVMSLLEDDIEPNDDLKELFK